MRNKGRGTKRKNKMERDVVRSVERQRMRESNERKETEEQQIVEEVSIDHLALEFQKIMKERHSLQGPLIVARWRI